MKNRMITSTLSALLLAACATTPAIADNEHKDRHEHGKSKFEFALIGDTPYGVLPGVDNLPFDRMRDDINKSKNIKWTLHAGDIKSGSTPCSDDMFMDRLQRYNLFAKPFVLTLGDNEWTDCHRIKAGQYQPLERLAKLREVFFSNPGSTLGMKPMQVETQAAQSAYTEFPENVRWIEKTVVFATMHIVGSNNAQAAFDPASAAKRTLADDEEVQRRTLAALDWMKSTFNMAMNQNAPGVFLMIHANPGLEFGKADRTGFETFLSALEAHAKAYGKPVVLAHGDSHYFRIDSPALVESGFVPNFTRVETFGASNVHWIRVKVDPDSNNVFSFTAEIVEEN